MALALGNSMEEYWKFWSQAAWLKILGPPLTSRLIMGQSLYLSLPQYLMWKNMDHIRMNLTGLLCGFNELIDGKQWAQCLTQKKGLCTLFIYHYILFLSHSTLLISLCLWLTMLVPETFTPYPSPAGYCRSSKLKWNIPLLERPSPLLLSNCLSHRCVYSLHYTSRAPQLFCLLTCFSVFLSLKECKLNQSRYVPYLFCQLYLQRLVLNE